MKRELLQEMAESGSSIAEISAKTGKSKTTVRHWLDKYGIKTTGKAGNKAGRTTSGDQLVVNDHGRQCSSCGEYKTYDNFYPRTDRPGTYQPVCKECSSEEVVGRAYKLKKLLVEYKGGACSACGLKATADNLKVFDFHHIEPEHKDYSIRQFHLTPLNKLTDELDKCILLCANCHQHEHHKITEAQGIQNKIKGNTELWRDNKKRKLDFIGRHSCDVCGYDEYEGSLSIKFKEEHSHYRKYNKTHWDEDFKAALAQSAVVCLNCNRTSKN